METRNSVTRFSDQELLTSIHSLVQEERRITLSLIEHLREVERRMLYAELGYGSLHEFATRHLGLSDGSAHRRISAMRLARDVPEVKAALASGKISLSNAAKIQVAFQAEKRIHSAPVSAEKKREILKRVEGQSQAECQVTLMTHLPSQSSPALQERVRQLSPETSELRIVLSADLRAKLDRLRALYSHAIPGAGYTELLDHLATEVLKKKSGSVAAGRTKMVSSDSRFIRAEVRKQVRQRADGRCEFPDCRSQYQLEIDHRVPWAKGGRNGIENLRLLCRTHNLLEARRHYGEEKMREFVPSLK